MNKVSIFIDGFNLYHGIKILGKQYYKWLNINKLSEYLIKPTDKIISINYFTAKVINNKNKQANQEKYISAISTLKKVNIFYGKYKYKNYLCPLCHQVFRQPIEKITDVNISVRAIIGAYKKEYEKAIFITGDTDLITSMKALKNEMNINVQIAFPPNRKNDAIRKEFPDSYRRIKEKIIIKSLLPFEVKTNSNHIIKCPKKWYKY